MNSRKGALIFFSFPAYATIVYSVYQIQSIRNKPTPNKLISEPLYQAQLKLKQNEDMAETYDSDINLDERFMFLRSKRKAIVKQATGNLSYSF